MHEPVCLEAELRADRREIRRIWIDSVTECPRRLVVVREIAAVPLSGHLRESADQHKQRADPEYGQDCRLACRGCDSFTGHPPRMNRRQKARLRIYQTP